MADLDINRDGKVSAEEKAADLNNDKKIDSAELIQYDAKVAEQTSAYDFLVNRYTNAGMPELGQWIANTIKGDPSLLDKQGELTSMLYNSEPYKVRFSGLAKLRDFNKKNPTNPVYVPSEIQYMETESQMKEILKPVASMYKDSINTVVGNLIGNQISPVELQNRVVIADTWVNSQDQNIKSALKQYYGIGDKELLQFALDPELGTAEIQRTAGAVQLGAQALRSSQDLTVGQSEDIVRQLSFSGMAENQYVAGIDAASTLEKLTSSGTLGTVKRLAGIEGTDISTKDILSAGLGIDTNASQEIAGLKSRERARFEGAQGGTNVLQTNVSGTV